jgi:hypothetical protein
MRAPTSIAERYEFIDAEYAAHVEPKPANAPSVTTTAVTPTGASIAAPGRWSRSTTPDW